MKNLKFLTPAHQKIPKFILVHISEDEDDDNITCRHTEEKDSAVSDEDDLDSDDQEPNSKAKVGETAEEELGNVLLTLFLLQN